MSGSYMVRVPSDLVDKYRDEHPELKGISATGLVEIMLRKALDKEEKQA